MSPQYKFIVLTSPRSGQASEAASSKSKSAHTSIPAPNHPNPSHQNRQNYRLLDPQGRRHHSRHPELGHLQPTEANAQTSSTIHTGALLRDALRCLEQDTRRCKNHLGAGSTDDQVQFCQAGEWDIREHESDWREHSLGAERRILSGCVSSWELACILWALHGELGDILYGYCEGRRTKSLQGTERKLLKGCHHYSCPRL